MDRRHDTRYLPPLLRLTRATLRPGHPVSLIDLSASGALVQGLRPLRPGGRVHLQVFTDSRTLGLNGQVLRCAVWALDADTGVLYRGAVKFDHRCELFWEAGTLAGSALPGPSRPLQSESGQSLPSDTRHPHIVQRTHAK